MENKKSTSWKRQSEAESGVAKLSQTNLFLSLELIEQFSNKLVEFRVRPGCSKRCLAIGSRHDGLDVLLQSLASQNVVQPL